MKDKTVKVLNFIWQKIGKNDASRRRNCFILFLIIVGIAVYAIYAGMIIQLASELANIIKEVKK